MAAKYILISLTLGLTFLSAACSTPVGSRADGIPDEVPSGELPPDDPFATVTDAGTDASVDAGRDAGRDAKAGDAARDGGDAGTDGAPSDAATDGGVQSGLQSAFTRFSVPPFPELPDGGGYFSSAYTLDKRVWSTVDLDGDGVLDLVQTSDPARAGSIVFSDAQGPYWKLYKGSRQGFSSTSVVFRVPTSGQTDGFFSTAYTNDLRCWTLLDVDGDKKSDLVQTADSARAGGYVWSDGAGPYWKVFKNTGTGFALAFTRFSVPASGLGDGFFAAYYGIDTRYWLVFDVDGDGLQELVQTANPARAGGIVFSDTAGAYWKVYRASSTGFSGTHERFSVPPSGLSDGFFSFAYTSAAPGTRFWVTTDVTGDGRPDLIQTADPQVNGGFIWTDSTGPYWKIFRGEAGGFSSIEGRVRLPASGLSDGFFASSYVSWAGSNGSRYWMLQDLDGDRRLEVVQTADPAQTGGQVFSDPQGPSWKVYRLREGAAAPLVERFAVPASGLSDGFFTASWMDSPPGSRSWIFRDMNGDAKPDLVQTSDPARPGLFVFTDSAGAYWKVWYAR